MKYYPRIIFHAGVETLHARSLQRSGETKKALFACANRAFYQPSDQLLNKLQQPTATIHKEWHKY